MRRHVKRAMWVAVGWAFLVLGMSGFIMPIIPGVPFLLIGLLILSGEYVWAKRLLGMVRRRFPKLTQRAESHTDRWRNISPGPSQTSAGD